MSHWYTIDDADLQVAYSGGWNVVTGSGHYMGSAHSTAETGATATLTFKGTGIKVWMSVPSGDWNQISTYRIKGDYIERHIECEAVPRFNELTFIREGLGEGPHTIVIAQEGLNHPPRGGAPVQLDRIEVLTSPQDPNPDPIYPAGVSPPSSQPPSQPPPPPVNPAPSSSNPLSPSQATSSSSPNASQQSPTPSSPDNSDKTTIVVTSGSSTFTLATALRESTTVDENGQPMITKVIPTRHVTTTDSTGGIVVRTEFVEVGASKSSGPSTGLLVGVIVAVLLLVFCLLGAGVFLWKRKQKKNKLMAEMATNRSFGDHLVENRGHGMGETYVNPFMGHAQSSGCSSPAPSNPFSPTGSIGQHSRDGSTTLPFTEIHEEAPPAYRLSSGLTMTTVTSLPVLTKERVNRDRT